MVAFDSPTFSDSTASDPLAVQNFQRPTPLEKSEEFPNLYSRPKNDSGFDPEFSILVVVVGQGDSDGLRSILLSAYGVV